MFLEYKRRRNSFFEQMEQSSAALFFANSQKIRSCDTQYFFHQDSDFTYLCGLNEPNALLVLLKSNSGSCRTILFNQSKDVQAELWGGRRCGQKKAIELFGVDQALPYEKVMQYLIDMLNQLTTIYHAHARYDWADKMLYTVLGQIRQGKLPKWRAPIAIIDWQPWLHEMRLFKTEAELSLMRQAAQITTDAHIRAMRCCRPELYEYQLEAEIHYAFAQQGARHCAYNTIVGSGENACILHYAENSDQLRSGDLVLIDAGCSYRGYASDVTRTFPVNGRFSRVQAELYDIVLQMQSTALACIVPGITLEEVNKKAIQVLTSGLINLGILHGTVEQLISDQVYKNFYMHGVGHWLGLDVHDVDSGQIPAQQRILCPNMVLTVEPGLYIAPDAEVAHYYRGIGIRIEDDIVITQNGYEILTDGVPKERKAIEQLMQLL